MPPLNVSGVGRLCFDPEMKNSDRVAICEARIAYDYFDREKKTLFLSVVVFGKRAEFLRDHFHKGDQISVAGMLRMDEWEGKDGQKRSKHVIVADRIDFVGGGKQKDGDSRREPAAVSESDDLPEW